MKIKTKSKKNPTYYYYYSLKSRTNGTYSHDKPKRTFFTARKFALMAVLLAVNFGIIYGAKNLPGGNESSKVAKVKAAATTKPIPLIDEQRLSTEINAVIAANPQLDIGVSVRDQKTNKAYTYGVDNVFIAASVGKLLSAGLYLQQVEKGERTLEDQVGGAPASQQLQKMIEKSDNPAWKSINDLIGHPALQDYAKARGINNYNAETNTITAAEVAGFLSDLHQQKLLNRKHSGLVLSYMKNAQEDMQFIRNYIDPSISVYHKAGWLSDRAHDTAIVERENRPYVLVIFTKSRNGDYNFVKGQDIFSGITKPTDAVFSVAPSS